MGKKTNGLILVLVLGAMALTPMASAHRTNTDGTTMGLADGTRDACRNDNVGACTAGNAVSGTYRGDAVFFVGSDKFGQPIAAGQSTPGGCDSGYGGNWDDNTAVGGTGVGKGCRAVVAGPRGCDTEWVNDGADPSNEQKIDDSSAPVGGAWNSAVVATSTDWGAVPDGTWDDAGEDGTACHVDNARNAWNNFGCANMEYAKDAAPLVGTRGPWLGNTCDYLKATPGAAIGTSCWINDFVLGVNGVSGYVGRIRDAVLIGNPATDLVPAVTSPPLAQEGVCQAQTTAWVFSCHAVPDPLHVSPVAGVATTGPCIPGGGVVCGRDAGPDDAKFGYGTAGVAGFTNMMNGATNCDTSAANPAGSGGSNAASFGNQWVFVYNYVSEEKATTAGAPDPVVVQLTSGWIDGPA
jgi:hypothetical protein